MLRCGLDVAVGLVFVEKVMTGIYAYEIQVATVRLRERPMIKWRLK